MRSNAIGDCFGECFFFFPCINASTVSKHCCQWASLHDHDNLIPGSNRIRRVYVRFRNLMIDDFFSRRHVRSDTNCSLFSINDLILSVWVFISINGKFVLYSPRKMLLDSAVVCHICCLLSSARIVTVSLRVLNCPPMSKT